MFYPFNWYYCIIKNKNIENIIIEHLDNENIPEKEKCRWMLKLYNNKHEFWKYVLYKLYMKNKNIIANPIISQFIEEDRKTLIPSLMEDWYQKPQ